jgi:hypothetical protein
MKEVHSGQPRLPTGPGVVLLLLAVVMAVGSLAIAWAPALGDNRSQVCRDRGAPYAPPYETWQVEAQLSWLPLGATCTWTDPAAGNVVHEPPAWALTALAGVSFASGLSWIAAAGWRRPQPAT